MLIEVFKAGTWTDSAGRTRAWTEADLEEIARKYNEQKEHEAPVVIGHPKENAPAYGWVERLEKRGKSLWAKIKPTVQEFVDWVKSGLYKKVSISLYPDLLLRHIGFLGGMPPAVKGLSAPEFAEGDYMELEFREWTTEEREKLAKGEIKGEFAGPDRTFPIASCKDAEDAWGLAGHAEDPDRVKRNIIRIARKYGWEDCLPETAKKWEEINMKEEDMEEKLRELEEKLKEKERQLLEYAEQDKAKDEEITRLKAEVQRLEAERRKEQYNAFCEELISEGKLTPAMRARAVELMECLHSVGEYEFSEGRKEAVELFKEFLSGMPKIVEFEEIAKKEEELKEIRFEASGRIDEERMELHRKAMEYMEKNKGITYKEAMRIIIKEV